MNKAVVTACSNMQLSVHEATCSSEGHKARHSSIYSFLVHTGVPQSSTIESYFNLGKAGGTWKVDCMLSIALVYMAWR